MHHSWIGMQIAMLAAGGRSTWSSRHFSYETDTGTQIV
jgi:hypothetical protein